MARGRRGAKSGNPPASGDVPDVYREMLADAVISSPTQRSEEGRPVKRRRVGGRIVTQGNDGTPHQSDHSSKGAEISDFDDLVEDLGSIRQQIVQTDSEDSAASDMDWEEVEIRDHEKQKDTPEPEDADSGLLNLVLGGDDSEHHTSSYRKVKRKPMTVEDRKLRLEIHKVHLCSLLAHVYLRNHWCNDLGVHTSMGRLLTQKNISYFNPDEDNSQFQRSRSFMDGLTQASDAFKREFVITSRGMAKPRWADSPETLALLQPPDDIDLPMQLSDFREAAHHLEASRDVGAQLFCAMLRSAGVDARLVCSLQPLPFQPSQKVELHEVKSHARRLAEKKARAPSHAEATMAMPSTTEFTSYSSGLSRTEDTTASESPQIIQIASSTKPLPSRKRRKPIRESKYPIYWVEAFNEAVQKWVPVDPLVTQTIAKLSKFEPPAGEPDNRLSYVIAFEDDGSARDVTKRYTKAYNAKTRRERIEVANGGGRWWRRVLKMYKRPHSFDRDQVEDAELALKEAAEPMPRNVQDFKDHPYYALERHLKRQEVIHPKREVGKVGAGRAGKISSLESVFRRRDVQMVKSADKWYRLGREIKPSEQPLKRVQARKSRGLSLDPEDQNVADEDNAGTALYAAHQTTVYSAPPVVNGRIPKNVYRNLDVYVPSMVPSGGIHIPHPETARAAKIIGIDYADAVTGFVFKGRHGTAVTKGAVIAVEYKEAVEEVIKAFEDDRARAEEDRRSLEALRMWKRMLAGLRIMERIEGYNVEGERGEREIAMQEGMKKVDEEDDEGEGGGFLPDRDAAIDVQPTAGSIPAEGWASMVDDDDGGGFLPEDEYEASPAQRGIDPPRPRDHFINNLEDDDGGGFLVNDGDADAEEALREINAASRYPSQSITRIIEYNPAVHDDRVDSPQAGGFLLDEAVSSNEPTSILTNEPAIEPMPMPTTISTSKHTPHSAIPDPSDNRLEETTPSQHLYETPNDALLPTMTQNTAPLTPPNLPTSQHPNNPPPVSSSRNPPPTSISPTKSSSTSPTSPSSASPPSADREINESRLEAESTSSSSSEERGSLLSHDPDDEDAEPEWLV